MANILMIPASGAIIFDSQSAGSSGISSLTGAPRLLYDNAGGLNITSYTTGSGTFDRFTVDGTYGRLFSVADSVTGTIFSVNDAAGLPVIEVESNLTDKITMGTYGSNALVVDDVRVGIGTGTPSGKLHIVDATLAGTGFLSGSALNIQQTWNTSGAPTAIKLNVFDIASTGTSNLMDLQVSGASKLTVRKDGQIIGSAGSALLPTYGFFDSNWGAGYAGWYKLGDTVACSAAGGTQTPFSISHVGIRIQNSIPFGWTNGNAASALDTILIRDGAANTLAQRNSSAPQESRIYGTYTNATNFERLNLKYNSTDSAFQIGTEKGTSGSARPLQLQTDNVTRMTLSTGGNVGIGTTTPNTKLYVVGKLAVNNSVLGGKALDVYTAEAGSAAVIQTNGLTNGDGILQLVSPSSSGVAYALRGSVQSNGAGIITIQQNGVGDAVLEALSISAGDSMSRYLINGGASYSVGIDNSDADKFKISNSSVLGSNDRLVINDSGYVGIGTTTPAYKLSISDTNDGLCFNSLGRFSSRFYHNNYFLTYDAGALDASNNAGFSLTTTNSNASPSIRFINSNAEGGIYLSTNASNQANLNFSVAGYGALTLRKGDNRQGNAILSSLTGDAIYNNASLLVRNRWDGSPGAVIAKLATGTTADIFQVTNESLSPYFNVTAIGNVGIGKTTPSARLHIAGGDTSLAFTGASLALGFGATATYPHFIHTRHNAGTPVSNAIDFYTSNGTEAGVYPSHAIHALTLTNGNVGIGTTAPNAKLSVVETSLAVGLGQTGSALDIQQTWNSDGSPTAIKLNVTNTNSAATSKLMDLQVSGVSKFQVDKNGNAVVLQQLNFAGDASGNNGLNFVRSSANLWRWGSNGVGDIAVIAGNSVTIPQNLIASRQGIVIRDIGQSVGAWLLGEASDVLAQRGATNNPQAYRLYNTYTSDTNFERLNFRWDSSVAKIGTSQGASSGLARDLVLETSGTERVRITASGLFSADGVSFGKGRAGIASNIAIGQSSLVKNISGSYNLAIGRNSLAENTNGDFNVAIGEASLRYSTVGSYNIAIGQNALINEQGSYTVAIGQNTLSNSSNGTYNVVMGHESLGFAIDSSSNVVIGYHAGLYDVAAASVDYLYNSVCIGTEASFYGPYGDNNSIAIGYSARGMGDNSAVFGNDSILNTYLKGTVQIPRLAANPFDYERIAMRWNGLTGTIGTSQVGTGLARDLVLETSGTERVRITAAGQFSANGIPFGRGGGNSIDNIAIGPASLNSNTAGANNIAIGSEALTNANGSNNVIIGNSAGKVTLSSGDELTVDGLANSILIGYEATCRTVNSDNNAIVIGYQAQGMGTNSTVLGNDSITNTYLKGIVQIHRQSTVNPIIYERIAMRWNGLVGTIGTSQTGVGTFARALALETNGTARMTIATSGNVSNSALFSTSGFAYTGIAPATTGAPGVSGEMAFSANFLYRHNGTNWQRTGIGFANW